MNGSRILMHWKNWIQKNKIDVDQLSPHANGAKAKQSTYDRLIHWAKKNEVLLVNDNPYSFILNDSPQSILSFSGAKDVALELNSLSKSFNIAGWRVGQLSGNKTNIQAVLKVKSNMDSGMFYGIQQGAIAALNAPTSWFSELNATYRKRRAMIETLATSMNTTFDSKSVGLFVWAKLNDTSLSAEAYIDEILTKKIFSLPLGPYSAHRAKAIYVFLYASMKNNTNRYKPYARMKIYVIGVGLIGGSMALDLKDLDPSNEIVGLDTNEAHLEEALSLGIIDQKEP